MAWEAIFAYCGFDGHDFAGAPARLTAAQIKEACQHFETTGAKEVRILCSQTRREDRPRVFRERGLFLLPVRNGEYVILKGEGYLDIPEPEGAPEFYRSDFPFELMTSKTETQGARAGNSEMQHLDYAFAVSLLRHFVEDDSLALTIRGRKYTPEFTFRAGDGGHVIKACGVQTEVDAGYEGREQVVLVEAKPAAARNVIIRQLYYPYRQWRENSGKRVRPMFFTRDGDLFKVWEFEVAVLDDYHSIRLVRSGAFEIGRDS